MSVSLGSAPAISNFPGGFANGVSIQNIPVLNTYSGRVVWLNNNNPTASDSNRGTMIRPFATLQGVMNATVNNNSGAPAAGRGDIVMVGAGHSETISSATALNISTSGIQIVGLGDGGLRPTFTLNTAATATITVSAPNVTITNCLFVANFAAIATLFTLGTTATDFRLYGCEFRDTSSVLNFVSIVTSSATANSSNGLGIFNSAWYGLGTTANTTLVTMASNCARLYVMGNYVQTAATTSGAAMQIGAGFNVLNMQMTDNLFYLVGTSGETTGILITTNQTTNTGVLARNMEKDLNDTSPILVTAGSGFMYYNNYHQTTADTSAYLLPAVGS